MLIVQFCISSYKGIGKDFDFSFVKGENQNDINENQWKIGYITGIKIGIK